MLNTSQIKPDMPVVCSGNVQFAVVDHLEGTDTIKLNRDARGQHHYIPMSWVKTIDDKVHVDRPGDQAMREWSTSPPVTAPPAMGKPTAAKSAADKPAAGKSAAGKPAVQPVAAHGAPTPSTK